MDGRRRADMQDTYDRIATHFSTKRDYAWPEVKSFLTDRTGHTGLDLGCGNCRHAQLLADRTERVLGADLSRSLLEIGRDRALEYGFDVDLLQADAATLPIGTGRIDLAVYIATIHHLPTREARLESLDELARILDTDGRALVSTWSTAHDRFSETEGFDTIIDWTLPGGETVDRFYHIYSPAEFEADLEASALEILEWEVSSGNCYAVVGSGVGSGENRNALK